MIGSALLSSFVLQIGLNLLPNNWAEEVAWSGFVQSRLQDRHGPWRAALLAGPLFALQHVSAVADATLGEAVFLMVVLAVLATPYRFVTGWVYNRTGSLLLVGLLHAAGNAAATGSGFLPGFVRRLYPESQLAGIAHLVVFAVVGIVVVIATRGQLGRPRRGGPSTGSGHSSTGSGRQLEQAQGTGSLRALRQAQGTARRAQGTATLRALRQAQGAGSRRAARSSAGVSAWSRARMESRAVWTERGVRKRASAISRSSVPPR